MWGRAQVEANRHSKAPGLKCSDNITHSVDMNWSKRREIVERRGPWHAAVHGAERSWTQRPHSRSSTHRLRAAGCVRGAAQAWGISFSCCVQRRQEGAGSPPRVWCLKTKGKTGVTEELKHEWAS